MMKVCLVVLSIPSFDICAQGSDYFPSDFFYQKGYAVTRLTSDRKLNITHNNILSSHDQFSGTVGHTVSGLGEMNCPSPIHTVYYVRPPFDIGTPK